MRPSEKFEAKAAGQKCSEAWFSPRREHFWPTTQASGFAAGRNRAGYSDRLLTLLVRLTPLEESSFLTGLTRNPKALSLLFYNKIDGQEGTSD